MILDSLKNAELYYAICPRLEKAFDYIRNNDLASFEAGKHIIDGDDIFVNIMERELKTPSDAKLEIHNVYADIQILLVGESEGFGWTERKDLNDPVDAFNDSTDVQFFNDAHQTQYTLKKGQFTILLPEDAHAPMIGEGAVKKAIVKVRL